MPPVVDQIKSKYLLGLMKENYCSAGEQWNTMTKLYFGTLSNHFIQMFFVRQEEKRIRNNFVLFCPVTWPGVIQMKVGSICYSGVN